MEIVAEKLALAKQTSWRSKNMQGFANLMCIKFKKCSVQADTETMYTYTYQAKNGT